MKLKSLLDRDFINPRAKVSTKDEAIDLVLKQFFHGYKFKKSQAEIKQAILEREALGGTLLENGMAIPHARLDGFNDLLIGIVIPEQPIIDEDGSKINSLVIFLTTKAGSTIYLQTLASFARLAMDAEKFASFLASSTPADVISSLDGFYVEKGMTVGDIMSDNLFTIRKEETLKDLADLFYKHRISYVPVVDGQDRLIGEVSMSDLLKVGIPNYAVMIGNLDFLSHFEPFEELLNNEDKIPVGSIMRKVTQSMRLDTSLIEAALILTKYDRRHLPVVKDGKILGVVSYMDLLSKVLRA